MGVVISQHSSPEPPPPQAEACSPHPAPHALPKLPPPVLPSPSASAGDLPIPSPRLQLPHPGDPHSQGQLGSESRLSLRPRARGPKGLCPVAESSIGSGRGSLSLRPCYPSLLLLPRYVMGSCMSCSLLPSSPHSLSIAHAGFIPSGLALEGCSGGMWEV